MGYPNSNSTPYSTKIMKYFPESRTCTTLITFPGTTYGAGTSSPVIGDYVYCFPWMKTGKVVLKYNIPENTYELVDGINLISSSNLRPITSDGTFLYYYDNSKLYRYKVATDAHKNNSINIYGHSKYNTNLVAINELYNKFDNVKIYDDNGILLDYPVYYGNDKKWIPLNPITNITLNTNMEYLEIGDTLQLSATITPSNASDKELQWTSSDTSVATVSSNGLVTKVADGSAVITCSSIDGSGTSATCTVDTFVPTTSVELDKSSANIVESYTTQLNATVYPNNATNKNITWSSSNTSIATVDDTGLVTAKVPGNCVITVTTEEGSLTDTCTITVVTDSFNNYTELYYIEGTGGQYIDLPDTILTTDDFGFELDAQIYTTTGANGFGGGSEFSSNPGYHKYPYLSLRNNSVKYSYNDGNQFKSFGSIDGNRHTYKFINEESNYVYNWYLDNTLKGTFTGQHPQGIKLALFTFKDENSSGVTSCRNNSTEIMRCKLYKLCFYSGTTKVYEFLPVMSNDGTKVGLWETVEHKFYSSSSSTAFVAGPEINE